MTPAERLIEDYAIAVGWLATATFTKGDPQEIVKARKAVEAKKAALVAAIMDGGTS